MVARELLPSVRRGCRGAICFSVLRLVLVAPVRNQQHAADVVLTHPSIQSSLYLPFTYCNRSCAPRPT